MSATLGDPVLLTTFGLPSSHKKGKGKEIAPDERPFLFATFSGVPKRDDEQVTLAVQGDGVHVYELGDLHPVSSRTLGPSTSFSAAPAVVVSTEGGTTTRRTYVTLHSAQEVKKEDADCVIWSWSEPVFGDTTSAAEKKSAKISHDIAYVTASSELSSVIVISRTGRLTRMDLDLIVQNTWSPQGTEQEVRKLFSFSARDCEFLPSTTSPNGYTMITFVQRGKEIFVRVIVFGLEGELAVLDPLNVPLEDIDHVIDVSLEPSGNMSILGSDGTWRPYVLELHGTSTVISPGSSSLRLKSLSFISQKGTSSHSVSILALNSSFVLLAGTTSKEIAVLLWDIQYGVLLHSTSLPIPSTLESPSDSVSVRLVRGRGSQALLILSPASANLKRSSQLRSSVLLVPFSVPELSTIAGAMGKADHGAQWVITNTSQPPQREKDALGKEAMLESLREAIESGRVKQADETFFNWINERDGRAKGGKTNPQADAANENEAQDVKMAENEDERKPKDGKKAPPLKSILDHSLVARILSIVFRPDEPPSEQYSPKICRYLVTKHLVSQGMVKGGLLEALLQRNDWETIRECFSNVVDLPEKELLRLLHVILRRHRNTSTTSTNDPATLEKPRKNRSRDEHWRDTPRVNAFLARVVDYPATQTAWRTALRGYFADIEDLTGILTIADEWMDVFATKEFSLSLGELTLNEHSASVPDRGNVKRSPRTKGVQMPSLEKLLSFLQAILDSSFLNLLQNSSSHALLQRISENITSLQSGILELQSLRGPLEPFARAQRRAVAEVANDGKKRDGIDWRKRRKQAHEQAALSLGPHQVEELVF